MRALRVHEFGQEPTVDEVDTPEPGGGELLIDIDFAALNPVDAWVAQGTVAGGSQALPFVLGTEATGRLAGTPVLVHGAGLGNRRDGLLRDRAVVPAAAVIALPAGMEPAGAAGIGVVGLTARRAVMDVGRARAGESVLVLGASGGVGQMALQIAAQVGAEVVGVTRSAAKRDAVADLGHPLRVLRDPDALRAAADLSPDLVIDPLAGDWTAAAVERLAPNGRLVLLGASAGTTSPRLDLRALYRKGGSILGYSGTTEPVERTAPALADLVRQLADGRLRVPIDSVIPLEEAPAALHRLAAGDAAGKVVVDLTRR
jgi:NADPH2:quinone reductase